MDPTLSEQQAAQLLSGGNAPFMEDLYGHWQRDPASVPGQWRGYFASLSVAATSSGAVAAESEKQGAVSRLVQTLSNRGHLVANIDPLGLMKRERPRVLDPGYVGLGEADLDAEFYTGSRNGWIPKRATLREILARLEQVYCGTIGAEFAHVSDTDERMWLQDEFQLGRVQQHFSAEEQRNILWQLTAAEGLERYLHTRFVGQKRFSLEGGEALIVLLDELVQVSGRGGVEETIIAMAHRGRLNVLVNVLGKSPGDLFSEFEGKAQHDQGSGDVKYHKGYSADLRTPGGNVHVMLAFNPSHLEIVNPVAEGSVRARQERRGDERGEKVLPILVHGDAAFAGQGVVMETLQMSQTRGYGTGGTIHVVINNQVGFTTSEPRDARSTSYCSDVAKMIEAPILHVNADDPEAVIFATRFALRYRQVFRKDIVIDLVCYRRLGHNEADEPAATQPLMYRAIRLHAPVRKLYAERLAAAGVLGTGEAEQLVEQYRQALDEGRHQLHPSLGMIGNKYTVDWSRYQSVDAREPVGTAVAPPKLAALGRRILQYPDGFTLHPRVAQIVINRSKMLAGALPLDWGCAETLAYASLLDEGFAVRISGQDCGRGTFFHRHAVLHDQNSDRTFTPLQHLGEQQPRFTIVDSLLSEEAVLGFEYGYSSTSPDCLVIWEGQFGDFVNGAQVLIDQFISSGEAKWGRLCGLTLFLPHGYEGQGPEHSSARLERFLQLCAENNMQVCVPSTPAQMFHMLRRQMLRPLRKPLIVMTPKSLLRHEQSVSALAELSGGGFATVIDDVDAPAPAGVRRIVFCSGKVYFDLLQARRTEALAGVAIVRIEQLYPFPAAEYAAVLARYPNAADLIWCQEEPQNQGAWFQIRHRLQEQAGEARLVHYAGRAPAAAPATGLARIHATEQRELVQTALTAVTAPQTALRLPRLTVSAALNPGAAAPKRISS
ncbi:MAG: 2-oxoglutarate dehydrogenase E1 component [Gammaproteobacteria bacterium]|nr:2-oxoglutarate dehydrogenase E1 component [Gammaproteobacteria bacterium]